MAVVNYFVDANMQVGAPAYTPKLQNAVKAQGRKMLSLVTSWTFAAGDSDGSIYRLFPSVPSDYIFLGMFLANDAIAGFTVADFGLYLPGTAIAPSSGAVVSDAIFASALSLAVAHNSFTPGTALDCGTAIVPQTTANANKRLWELVGEALFSTSVPRQAAFDICLTADTRGANGGNAAAVAYFAQG